MSIRSLEPGEVLFAAGEPGHSIFGVISGSLELSWGNDSTEQFAAGDVLGVGALVTESHRRHGTARALVASEVVELNREQFLFAVQETPIFALELMAGLERRQRRVVVQSSNQPRRQR
ncbi:MAG: Crp/Fnr family transcriptional regulator [Cyanobacteriota bacterium]